MKLLAVGMQQLIEGSQLQNCTVDLASDAGIGFGYNLILSDEDIELFNGLIEYYKRKQKNYSKISMKFQNNFFTNKTSDFYLNQIIE